MNILNKLKVSRNTVSSEYEMVNTNPFAKYAIQALVLIVDLLVMFLLIWNMFHFFIPAGSWLNIVEGDSMYPTMHNGQVIYTDMTNELHRGDVVTAKMTDRIVSQYPEYEGMIMVKRIIGVPGDRVVIDENDNVYINGNLLSETYLTESAKSFTYQIGKKYNSVKLDKGEYFIMGDNREVSYDSRSFGVITKDDILYKQSETPTQNFWIKLALVIVVFALDICLYSLIEFILTECAYAVFFGKKKNNVVNSKNTDFNNITTSETVILKGDKK